ncbi:MAG: hypothetical protein M1479_06110 [Actinobacteria bacterium]|nr:hypothetical protein [Cyanobacteriota bacterium]MCL5771829.1 hypothetical protein [Actinomycetota bacterium]
MTRRVYFREIYFYIICMVAIVIFIIGLVQVYDGAINYVKPTTYLTKPSVASMYSQEQYKNLTAEQIDKLVQDEINASIENEKDMAFKNLLRGVLLVIISIPLFAFHWRKAQQMWKLSLESKDSE